MSPRSNQIRVLVALLAIAFTCAIYWPGLKGPFIFDDVGNILMRPSIMMDQLTARQLADAALSADGSQVIQRPLPRLTFALNYYFSGQQFTKFNFKVTNLIIHIVNGLLVLWLVSLLRKAWVKHRLGPGDVQETQAHWKWFPFIVAFLWTIHPIQLTGVLYIVQRMTSMSATAVLAGLAFFVIGRQMCDQGRQIGLWVMAAAVAVGTILGIASKENAALLPLFAVAIEFGFFNRHQLTRSIRVKLYVAYGFLLFSLVVVAIALLTISADFILRIYDVRNFTPLERVLTQSRVLFMYLGLILFPRLSDFSLFHDTLAFSTGLFSPLTTLFSVLGLTGMGLFCLYALRRGWMIGFCIAWYFVGHAIESSFLGLELVFEHRNYLPALGPIMAGVYYGYRLYDLVDIRKAVVAALVAVTATMSFVTFTRATNWSSLQNLVGVQVERHPNSARSQMGLGVMLQMRSGDIQQIYSAYQRAADLNRVNALPVIRMQRYVSGLIAQLDDGSLAPDTGLEFPAKPNLYEDPLFVDAAYLRKLDRIIDAEVTHRLSAYAIDAETTVAMNEMRVCVGSAFSTCPPPERVEKWLRLILDKEVLFPEQRMSMLVLLARVRLYSGDTETALALLRDALPLTVDKSSIWIEMLGVHRSVRDYDSIRSLLAEVEDQVEASGRRVAEFRKLKAVLLEEASSHQSPAEDDQSPGSASST